jgi:hypothetical protein
MYHYKLIKHDKNPAEYQDVNIKRGRALEVPE